MNDLLRDHATPIDMDMDMSMALDIDIDNANLSETDTDLASFTESLQSLDTIDYELQEAKKQWLESLQQLNQVVNWVILPLLGKFLGRKCAQYLWRQVFT